MMTEQEQRIAIAKWVGWTKCITEHCSKLSHPTGKWYHVVNDLPDYPLDLNAMHEAEKNLTISQKMMYVVNLHKITESLSSRDDSWKNLTSTSQQRSEALCRTL